MRISKFPVLLIAVILCVYLFFAWFVCDPLRASRIDRYILYNVDEIFHYCYVRAASWQPLAILNPYAKPLYTLLGLFFCKIMPFSFLSLRIMNVIFSSGILLLMYKLMKKMEFEEKYIIPAILFTATFPLYFIVSLSGLTEIIFCFFALLSIYLFYCRYYLFSAVCVSLLPLIRHEGFLFVLIWAPFLIKEKRPAYGAVLLLPSAIWVFLNSFFLGRPFYYSLLHQAYHITEKINQAPPDHTVGAFLSATSLISIVYQPLFILAVIGWIVSRKENKYRLISACWGFYLAFLLVIIIAHLVIFKTATRELRYALLLVPLMSLYAAEFLKHFSSHKKQVRDKLFTILAMALIFILVPLSLKLIQADKRVCRDSLSESQEEDIKEASLWLNGYLRQNSIANVYLPGRLTTDKLIRRILMNLEKNINFYPTIDPYATSPVGEIKVLDVITFEIMPRPEIKGVFIMPNLDEFVKLGDHSEWELIKSFPHIPMYFFFATEREGKEK